MQIVEVPREALVIRFSPFTAEKVLARAGLARRRRGQWTSSVFADLKRTTESDDDLHMRLLAASELHDIDPSRNEKYDVCTRAGQLLDAGFTVMKDGDEDEVQEHYSVRLGDSPTLQDVEHFLGAFTERRRRPR